MQRLTKATQQNTAFGFGAGLVLVFLAIAIFFPDPTTFQYTVFRIILALAAAGVAAMIPGFISVEVGTTVRAGGALAVFVIVFFFSPAAMVVDDPPNSASAREYGIYIEQVHADNVRILENAAEDQGTDSAQAKKLQRTKDDLDRVKEDLKASVARGEQMNSAQNRVRYNEKLESLKTDEGLGELRNVIQGPHEDENNRRDKQTL